MQEGGCHPLFECPLLENLQLSPTVIVITLPMIYGMRMEVLHKWKVNSYVSLVSSMIQQLVHSGTSLKKTLQL